VTELELRRVDARGDLVPRLAVAELGRFLPTAVGEGEEALARLGVGGDEALVLEEREGGGDGTRARAPHPAGALLELPDHLVPVHRTLGEEREGRSPHVAPTGAPAGSAPATATAATEAEGLGGSVPAPVRVVVVGVLLELLVAGSHVVMSFDRSVSLL